jgi:eukaryotic-like serine/threonine-protein kinase
VIERFGSCRVLEEIGSGAVSTVYKAVQEPLGRTVAVKALKPTIATGSPFAAHLEREAKVLGELGHPNVITLLDYVKTEQDLYLVLDYVDGRSLSELLARKKTIRPEAVAALGSEMAHGLVHVHARGFVHRDVKPANILLSKTGEVKLVDFGIAQRERTPHEDESLVQGDAAAFGTPAYMSPEQILGELVDARSDLFSLGVVLYQMVAGVRPFDGPDASDGRTAAQRIRRDPAKPLRSRSADVPRVLERVIMRLLEKLPADRPGSAAAVADELDAFLRAEVRAPSRSILVRALREAGLTQVATPFGGVAEVALLPAQAPLRRVLLGFGALFFLLVAGGAAIQWSPREASATTGEGDVAVGLGASLHVVATPWAEVWVDGRHVDTTPFARAIPLRPGKHYVKLTHPEAEPETRTVSLTPGEDGRLEVTMRLHSPQGTSATEAGSAGAE